MAEQDRALLIVGGPEPQDRALAFAEAGGPVIVDSTDPNSSDCCCDGGLFFRARDCCRWESAWFPVGSLQCQETPGQVFLFDLAGRCFVVLRGAARTRAQILLMDPSAIIYTTAGNGECLSGCSDGRCPDCWPDCCWHADTGCTKQEWDCNCPSSTGCDCGQEWVYSWVADELQDDYDADGSWISTRHATSSGTGRFRFEDRPDGTCELVVLSWQGAGRDTYTTIHPPGFDYQFEPGVLFMTCGASMRNLSREAFLGSPAYSTLNGLLYYCELPGPRYPCNCEFTTNHPNGNRAHHSKTSGAANCLGGSGHTLNEFFDDTAGQLRIRHEASFQFALTVVAPCGPAAPPGFAPEPTIAGLI